MPAAKPSMTLLLSLRVALASHRQEEASLYGTVTHRLVLAERAPQSEILRQATQSA